MFKKTITLALIAMISLFFDISSTQAQTAPLIIEPEEINIITAMAKNPDCISPTPGMVITEDTTLCAGTYEYPAPVLYDFITMGADNITLDCNGATLYTSASTTNGRFGIRSYNFNNIEIKNCTINNYFEPIFFHNSNGSTIHDSQFNYGMLSLNYFGNGQVYNLTKSADTNGIPFINLIGSDNNQINNNIIYSNGIIDNPNNKNIGLQIYSSDSNEVFNNDFNDNDIAVQIIGSSNNNNIHDNNINGATWNGIIFWLRDSYVPNNNNIHENNINNSYRDIVIGPGANDNNFENNTLTNTLDKSIYIWSSGISSNIPATNNQFINNKILGTGPVGIEMMSYSSTGSYFEANQIKNRTNRGIIVESNNNNAVFTLNNIVNNAIQTYNNDPSTIFNNALGGNFWSDYDEPSEGCNDTDIDGDCDLPYTNIAGTAAIADNQPLTGAPTMQPIANQIINEGQTLQLTINVTDGNDSSVLLSANYPNGTFGATFINNGDNTGTFTWKPWYNQTGTGYEVIFSAFDGVHTVEDTVLIDVNNYIVPPPTITLNASAQTVVAGQAFTLTLSGSSEEALASVWWGVREQGNYTFDNILGSVDGTSVNLASAQGYGTCQGETYCEFTRTVIIDEPGNYEIWANSRDTIYFSVIGEPHQASEGLGIPVINVNVAPTFSSTPTTIYAAVGKPVSFKISANDKNGDALNLVMIKPITGAIFSTSKTIINTDSTSTVVGNFSWTPNIKQSGTYLMQFQVTDNNGAVVLSTPIEIVVRNLNTKIINFL